jgi:hypothetical protein
VTTPDAEPTVAIVVLPELQVPPVVALLNVVVAPEQIVDAPEMLPGTPMTVTVVVGAVPQPFEYVITAVPGVPPVTEPVSEPMVAIDVLLLLHVPPVIPSLNVRVAVVHTFERPLIGPGLFKTVTSVGVHVTLVDAAHATGAGVGQVSTHFNPLAPVNAPAVEKVMAPAGKLIVPPPVVETNVAPVYTAAPLRYHVGVTVSVTAAPPDVEPQTA